MLDLYHWEPNGGSLALLICLKEKRLEFRDHYVDMLGLENHSPAYRELSPQAAVPVLVAEGEAMTDTGLALQYLAERYPEPRLAPGEAAAWYDLQAWLASFAGTTGLSASVRQLGWTQSMVAALPADRLNELRQKLASLPREKRSGWEAVWSDAEADDDQRKLAEERIAEAIGRIETALAQSSWIVGEEYSIVDIAAYAEVHCLPNLVPELVAPRITPRVCDWLSRLGERPAVAESLDMRRLDVQPAAFPPPGRY